MAHEKMTPKEQREFERKWRKKEKRDYLERVQERALAPKWFRVWSITGDTTPDVFDREYKHRGLVK